MKKLALALTVAVTGVAGAAVVSTRVGVIDITPLAGNAFRVTRLSGNDTLPSVDNNLRAPLHSWLDADNARFTAKDYELNVDRNSGVITFIDADGDTLLTEYQPLSFIPREGSSFYGAGERGHSLSLNGDSLVMWNRPNYGYGEGDPRISQMGITMPYLLSNDGYGLLFNDPSKALLTLGDTVRYESGNPRNFSYTFIGGGTMPETTSNFTAISGRQDLPPFWSLGYITSKYGYHTDKEALGAVDSLKSRGFPVDGLIFDLYWYGTETDMGRLEWNRKQFPDHKAMLDSLKSRGVNTVLIHQPYINKKGALDNYQMLAAENMLTRDSLGTINDVTTWVGDAGMFDISNPATREWLWSRLRNLTAEGVAGWWGDLGEPEVHPLTILHHNGLGAVDYHNIYCNDWSRMIYEGLRHDFPDMRPFLMMRGGSTGLQRYSVFPWTGDVARSWQGLQPQIKLMLNSGLSGLGYMSSDIGGFAVDPKKPYDPELYLRWVQMGVFTPVLRTHAQAQPEPYHYPQYQKELLDLIRMRYRWLPYNYTLAYENAADGQPLARPVNYYSSVMKGLENVTDEYLWGSEVLVAPVMTAGARSRKVLFPDLGLAGADTPMWVDWYNPSVKYRGGTEANVKAPLDKLPLFVRSGSFIPQYERPLENVTQYDPRYLTVKYFASAQPSDYVLFDDDRQSPTSLSDGEYRLTRFQRVAAPNGGYKFVIESEGKYEGMPAERELTFEVIGISRPKAAGLDGKPLAVSYDARRRTATLHLTLTAAPATLTLTF